MDVTPQKLSKVSVLLRQSHEGYSNSGARNSIPLPESDSENKTLGGTKSSSENFMKYRPSLS